MAAQEEEDRFVCCDGSLELKEHEESNVMHVVADILDLLSKNHDFVPFGPPNATRFHSVFPPQLSIKDYFLLIGEAFKCSPSCFILCMIYIDRLIRKRPTLIANSLAIHRLSAVSLMTAAKFFDDHYHTNTYYGQCCGLGRDEKAAATEMNALEIEFLFMIGFELFVDEQEFQMYERKLYAFKRPDWAQK